MHRQQLGVLPEEHMVYRFIFAFGGAGLFTFLTAVTGLAGVGWNSRWLLGTYSVLLVIMLLVQAAVAITLFADDSWRKYLPPDQTGEFHKVLKQLPVLSLHLEELRELHITEGPVQDPKISPICIELMHGLVSFADIGSS